MGPGHEAQDDDLRLGRLAQRMFMSIRVVPAQAGTQQKSLCWIAAFAAMTKEGGETPTENMVL